MFTLTLFDIITLSIIAVSSLLGIYRGFVHIFINLVGFIASIFVAFIVYPYVKILFIGHITNEMVMLIAAGVVAYIISLIFFTYLTSKILFLIKNSTCGFFDRVTGLVAGLIRGVIFSVLIFVLIAIFTSGVYLKVDNLSEAITELNQKDYPKWLKDSYSATYYEEISRRGASFLPKDMLEQMKMPGKEKDEEKAGEDVIDLINKKKNKEGVTSSVDVQERGGVDEDLEKLDM